MTPTAAIGFVDPPSTGFFLLFLLILALEVFEFRLIHQMSVLEVERDEHYNDNYHRVLVFCPSLYVKRLFRLLDLPVESAGMGM